MTPVLIGKGHILGGWWSKIEVIQVLGIYMYIQMFCKELRPVAPREVHRFKDVASTL